MFYLQLFSSLKLSPFSSRAISQQLNQMMQIDKIDFPVLKIPSLYVYGENDRMLKDYSEQEIIKLLPDIEIIKIPKSSHILNGDLLFEKILSFLNN